LFSAVPHIGQAWSIGVEEQFYLIWPLIISKTTRLVRTLIFVVLGLIFFKIIILVLGQYYYESSWYIPLKRFVAMSKFECMAIGGIGAYLLFSGKPFISYLYYKSALVISVLLIVLLIYITPDRLQDGIHLIYSVLFLIVIIHVSDRNNSRLLEHKVFNYLGQISYGIYMYHFMIIPIVLVFIKKNFLASSGLAINIYIYTLAILLTIIVSAISYHVLEKPFIRKKSKYSPIKSGGTD
jgi:peptidoglycan/LPS O-acetylase OafA/YrhL